MEITSALPPRTSGKCRPAGLIWLLALCLFLPVTHAQQNEKLVVIGDSLSAAYGIAVDDGWVAQLQNRLDGSRHEITVVNASVSGDTTASGVSRLPQLLADHSPKVVVIELGGNDGLRGLSLKKLRENLIEMITQSQQAGADVLVLGVRIPSNYGGAYTRRFSAAFAKAADQTGAQLVPQLLRGLEQSMEWFQDDGIHPNVAAQTIMLDNVWPVLEPMLDAATVN